MKVLTQLCVVFFAMITFAQPPKLEPNNGNVSGRVIDAKIKEPLLMSTSS